MLIAVSEVRFALDGGGWGVEKGGWVARTEELLYSVKTRYLIIPLTTFFRMRPQWGILLVRELYTIKAIQPIQPSPSVLLQFKHPPGLDCAPAPLSLQPYLFACFLKFSFSSLCAGSSFFNLVSVSYI